MPKIQINEIDRTGVVQKAPISNVVYMPILTSVSIPLLKKGKIDTLCSSREDLNKFAGAEPDPEDETKTIYANLVSGNDESKLGYNIAKRLIDLGFQVLLQGLKYTAGSTEPATDAKADCITDADVATLKDKGLVDIRFLTAGTSLTINAKDEKGEKETLPAKLAAVAAARKDCTFLVNLDEDAAGFSYVVSDVRAGFEAFKDNIYAAGFTPWFYTNHPTLIAGMDDDEGVKIPAAYGYLFAYANMLGNNVPEWFAVAGPQRGRIPELADVLYDYNSADVEMLQSRAATEVVDLDDESDNVGAAINPICNVRPNGYIIYGNRTLKDNDSAKKTTAQSFLNVRNGVNAIKKTLYNASRAYVFEQNTDLLWVNFQNYLTPLLDRMKNGAGILGYKFVKVNTDAKARLRAKLTIIPVEAVEDFEIDVYLVDDLTVTEE